MGRPKKDEKPEIPSSDPELERILKDLCNDEWQALTLVKHLEGILYSRSEKNLALCKSYVIALIQTYCKSTTWEEAGNGKVKPKRIGNAEDKVEFVLAIYGLLEGFEFDAKKLSIRKRKYYDYAHGHNELVSGVWEGASIDTMTRDVLYDIAWELANTLHDLKIKNDNKLGFLEQAPKELKLPSLRNFDEQNPSKAAGSSKRGKRVPGNGDGEKVIKFTFSQILTVLLITLCFTLSSVAVICVVSFVKNTFSPVPPQTPYNPTLIDNTTLVEKIRCTQPLITVYPGVVTPLPIEVAPNEAAGAYLLCDSTDKTVLTGIDGVFACVRASEYFEPGTRSAEASVIVKPLHPESSDVFIEVPIEVDYTVTIPEPLN